MNEQSLGDKTTAVIYPRDSHNLSRRDIDLDALKILYRLSRFGHKGYLVGGGVRDILLGKKPKDYDIATDARPRQIRSLFRNCRIIGRRFKLAHIYFGGGKIIEVSTFRQAASEEEEGEDPDNGEQRFISDNVYGDEQSDAIRRDLTINALFYDLSRFSIIDYVGGVSDLKARLVRVIGDPEVRYAEDPVRMIRVVRHAARTNFNIESGTAEAINKCHGLILSSSNVRVYEELKKDLCSGHAASILQLLHQHQLLQHLISALADDSSKAPLSPESPLCQALQSHDLLLQGGELSSATTVLALLIVSFANITEQDKNVHDFFADSESLLEAARCSFSDLAIPRKERERVSLVLQLTRKAVQSPQTNRELLRVRESDLYPDIHLLLRSLNWRGELYDTLEALNQVTPGKTRSSRRKPRYHNRRGAGRDR